VATYAGLSGNPENIFHFGLINGMPHAYPNHHLKLAEVNWRWMKDHRLP
jgi:hypothetical protein